MFVFNKQARSVLLKQIRSSFAESLLNMQKEYFKKLKWGQNYKTFIIGFYASSVPTTSTQAYYL
jgi:hypothetical protein